MTEEPFTPPDSTPGPSAPSPSSPSYGQPPPGPPTYGQPPQPTYGQPPTAGGYAGAPGPGYPGYGAPGAGYPGYGAPGYGMPGYGYFAPRNNNNALIALILAIVSWVACPVVPAVIALVMGRTAKAEIAASNGAETGEGMVTAANIISWINIGLYGALLLLWLGIVVISVAAA